MRRVVVTGLGIVSSIGNNAEEVLAALKAGASGITANEAMKEHGFRSQIAGDVKLDVADHVDKRTLRFMGRGAAYAYIAMQQAIEDAGLTLEEISHPRIGLVAGSGGPSTSAMLTAHQVVLNSGAPKRIGPFAVPKCMSSTISAKAGAWVIPPLSAPLSGLGTAKDFTIIVRLGVCQLARCLLGVSLMPSILRLHLTCSSQFYISKISIFNHWTSIFSSSCPGPSGES